VDVLLRGHRATAAAAAFHERAPGRSPRAPTQVITNHHQPYVTAVRQVLPGAEHSRAGLHQARGETTKSVERRHVPTRDRLHAARGLKTITTGQRFLEGFEALRALRQGHIGLGGLLLGQRPRTSPHERARAVGAAVRAVGARLTRVPR
jgi:transposase-like protein